MKKRIIIWGALIIATIWATVVYAGNIEQLTAYVVQFRVFVNGEERSFENPIVTINDRTYVPLREVSEVLGMDVKWDGENQKIIINSQSVVREQNTLYPFEQGGLWGYKDADDNVVIEPQFAFAHNFSEGLAFVVNRPEGIRGYIDLTGKMAINLPLDGFLAREFTNGFAITIEREWDWENEDVFVRGTPGPFIFIDRTGQNVFGKEFTSADDFNEEGFARVILLDGFTRTYIDRNGNLTGETW